jgi:hypothetical protein
MLKVEVGLLCGFLASQRQTALRDKLSSSMVIGPHGSLITRSSNGGKKNRAAIETKGYEV